MKCVKAFRNTLSDINTTNILVGILTILTVLSGLFLGSNLVSADNDSVVDEINITVPISCSISGTGMNTHNANISNGLYVPDIGTTTLHAFCNDNEGFAIYAAGYTGNEVGATNSNKLVGTTASNNAVIETGTATGPVGDDDISNWAMKLSIVSSPTPTYPITIDSAPNVSGGANASFSDYHTVPNGYTKVAHRDSGTDIGQSAEGATLNTTYAAYISKTQPADTYSGQVIYTLVHPSDADAPLSPQQATPGCINYFANASNAVGTMGCQSATDGNTTTLLASNFSRTGYGFAGWSDKYDYATNQSAHFYGPNETITVPTGTTANGLSLYAVWIKSEGSIQDTNKVTSLCGTNGVGGTLTTAPTDGTANLSSVSALTDQRDNQTYAIARLADGNCWMIENLRLESTNSDNATGALAQGYGTSSTYGNFSGLATAENTNFSNSTTANSLYYSGTQSGTASVNIGTYNPGYRMPRYNNANTSIRASSPTNNNENMYSYGNYYTWSAAIADTTYYSSSGDHGTTSLCPKGWRLPKGNTALEGFGKLDVDMDGTGGDQTGSAGMIQLAKWRSYPNNFLYAGRFAGSSVGSLGSYGYYWSSVTRNGSKSYNLLFYGTNNLYPGTDYENNYGGSTIRCLFDA